MNDTPRPPVPLVLIPGLLLTGDMWAQQAPALHALGSVHVSEQHRRHSTIGAIADAVLAEVDGPLAVCGLSMGGYIALEICRRAPQRVQRLALLSTGARSESAEQTAARDELIALGRSQGMRAVVDTLWPRLVHAERHDDNELLQAQYRMAEETGQTAFEREQNAIKGRRDQRAHLAAIGCPTLIVCGREDRITPHTWSEEMHAGIAGSELLSLDQCGHLSAMEQPQAVTRALAQWWTGRPAVQG